MLTALVLLIVYSQQATACSDPSSGVASGSDPPHMSRLMLVVATYPGRGQDELARSMARVLKQTGLVDETQVVDLPGGQGVVGIGHVLAQYRGDETVLLVAGRNLAESTATGQLLRKLTPIARITGEYEVLAFPGGSDVESMDSVAAALRSKPAKLPRVSLSYLQEQGMDPAAANWRGVFAASDLNARQMELLDCLLASLVRTAEWKSELARAHSTDFYLPPAEFTRFLDRLPVATAATTHAALVRTGTSSFLWRAQVWMLHARLMLVTILLMGLGVGLFFVARLQTSSKMREGELSQQLAIAREDVDRGAEERAELLRGVSKHIDSQMERWHLTKAEQEVAMLLLKGLRHTEIADLRETSEGTVRQQAASVYKKAGISGRTELAAFFLEDFLTGLGINEYRTI